MSTPSFTCPVPICGMTSYNPNNIKFGYCGNCHAYTGQTPMIFGMFVYDKSGEGLDLVAPPPPPDAEAKVMTVSWNASGLFTVTFHD